MDKNKIILAFSITAIVGIVLVFFITSQNQISINNENQTENRLENANIKINQNNNNNIVTKTSAKPFTANINSNSFEADIELSFFENGMAGNNAPYLKLILTNFVSDYFKNGNFTIQMINFEPKVGKFFGKINALFMARDKKTNNDLMYSFDTNNSTNSNDFFIEITKWEKISSDKALVSGKILGTLNPSYGNFEKIVFENGVFENVEVSIF